MRKSELKRLYEYEKQKNEELEKRVSELTEIIDGVGIVEGDAERISKIISECNSLKEQWNESIVMAKKARFGYEQLYKELLTVKDQIT